jgi:non-specific serine/threonine protein kinase
VSNALSASETCDNLSGLTAMAGRVVYGAGDIAALDDGSSSSIWRIARRRDHSQTVPRTFSGGGIMTMSRRDVPATVRFGRFRLDRHRHELLADGVPVPIGSRALDVLIVLTEANGELVTKDELMSRVWPGAVVEENTLQFQISTLRKALGFDRDFIKTICGRGYRFIADISTCSDAGAISLARRGGPPPSTSAPPPTSDLAGREATLAELADLVAAHRLATRAGAGIDKTGPCMALRRRLLAEFADGAWITALGSLPDLELVLPTVATALGLAEADAATSKGLTAALGPRPLLFLLSIGTEMPP